MSFATRTIFKFVSIAILSLGFAQFSAAGPVGTTDLMDVELRGERISKLEALVARADVAEQLQKYGVTPELVSQRVHNLTSEELLELEQSIDQQVAGADVIGVVGVVFVVLIILELVGVTDIFKSF